MLLYLPSTDSDWTLCMIRSILGVDFFSHGSQKLLDWFGGPGLKETMHILHESLGLPILLALLTVAAEFFGGLGLIVGLMGRFAAGGIAIVVDWFATEGNRGNLGS